MCGTSSDVSTATWTSELRLTVVGFGSVVTATLPLALPGVTVRCFVFSFLCRYLDFAQGYNLTNHMPLFVKVSRHCHVETTDNADQLDVSTLFFLIFCFVGQAENKISVNDTMNLMRTHFEVNDDCTTIQLDGFSSSANETIDCDLRRAHGLTTRAPSQTTWVHSPEILHTVGALWNGPVAALDTSVMRCLILIDFCTPSFALYLLLML